MTYEYPDYIAHDCSTEGNTCLGSSGRIGLWIAFGCMFVPMLIFWFKAASKPAGQRKFEYLSMAINGIASLAYLTMATGYGATIVNKQEFFFARYIDWTLTTPLMLIGLIRALQGGQDSSWVFFAFSMFMFCPIFFYLLCDGSFKADIDPRYAGVYTQATWLTAIFWCGYPIAWVLHEGTSTISLNAAVIVYLILDTICKSVWGFLITMGRDSVEPEEVAL